MTFAPHPTDDDVLALLGHALAVEEPLPHYLLARAYDAFSLAAFEDALAELIFDSRQAQPMLMRGEESEARLLSFANDFLTLDLSLAADGVTILGEVNPPGASEVLTESRSDVSRTFAIDAFGRFRLVCEAASFRIRIPGKLVTPWIARD